jgi:hypothetical protein
MKLVRALWVGCTMQVRSVLRRRCGSGVAWEPEWCC